MTVPLVLAAILKQAKKSKFRRQKLLYFKAGKVLKEAVNG
jgi:nucleoid DNA-binding protein